jgi:hypothetical protein
LPQKKDLTNIARIVDTLPEPRAQVPAAMLATLI